MNLPLLPYDKLDLQYKTHDAPPRVDIPTGGPRVGLTFYVNYFWTPIQGYIYTWMYMYRYFYLYTSLYDT